MKHLVVSLFSVLIFSPILAMDAEMQNKSQFLEDDWFLVEEYEPMVTENITAIEAILADKEREIDSERIGQEVSLDRVTQLESELKLVKQVGLIILSELNALKLKVAQLESDLSIADSNAEKMNQREIELRQEYLATCKEFYSKLNELKLQAQNSDQCSKKQQVALELQKAELMALAEKLMAAELQLTQAAAKEELVENEHKNKMFSLQAQIHQLQEERNDRLRADQQKRQARLLAQQKAEEQKQLALKLAREIAEEQKKQIDCPTNYHDAIFSHQTNWAVGLY